MFMVAVYSADVHLVSPNLNGRIVTPLMGWQFRTANFAERFGPIRFACVPVMAQPTILFEQSGLVAACRVHASFPGVNIGDVTHQFPELGRQP